MSRVIITSSISLAICHLRAAEAELSWPFPLEYGAIFTPCRCYIDGGVNTAPTGGGGVGGGGGGVSRKVRARARRGPPTDRAMLSPLPPRSAFV